MFGAFIEDINRAVDGGLYAEMLQNRSFEDAPFPLAWNLVGNARMTLDRSQPLNASNPTCLRLDVSGPFFLTNEGFKGTPLEGKLPTPEAFAAWRPKFEEAARRSKQGLRLQKGKAYDLTLYARSDGAKGLTASLTRADGTVLAAAKVPQAGKAWRKVGVRLVAKADDTDARLVLSGRAPGTLWLDMVSLFPEDAHRGLRPDLYRMLADLHPGLLRFPGGSFSEGAVLAAAWRWKETIGDVAARPGNWNIWGYRSTNGMGFHEYLQLAEDLHAAPLYVAHVGMSEKEFVPMRDLGPWVQDALDAIEYANGPVTSKWGVLRAKAGHPKPFGLKYVEIGNENGSGYPWGGGTRADYLPRYRAFYDAIKAKYPDVITLANIDTRPDAPAEMVDEHDYESSDWFLKQTHRYDAVDRRGPKLYVGEYAVRNDAGRGNLRAALAEAAFLTGVERNADVVRMTSYAPFFVNPEWQRWNPNAVVFDNARAYGTPSYWVQWLFANDRPDATIPVEVPAGLFATAGRLKGEIVLKVVNSTAQAMDVALDLGGPTGPGTVQTLTASSPEAENSFDAPTLVAPVTSRLLPCERGAHRTFPAYSVTVIRMKAIRLR